MATLKIVLYKSKTYKDGTHPLMAQITNNRKVSKMSTGLKLFPNEWNSEASKLIKPRSQKGNIQQIYNDRIRIIKNLVDRVDLYLLDIKRKGDKFKIEGLKDYLDNQDCNSTTTTVQAYYNELIEVLKLENRIGTARSYSETIKSIKSFYKKSSLTFFDVDVLFLKKYEKYLRDRGGSNGGVSVRMRNLRAVIKSAIADGTLPERYYPFSKHKKDKLYIIPKSESNPRAMSMNEFELFKSFDVDEYPHLAKYYNYAMFSYYSRGMNFIDMARFQLSQIRNSRIYFVRSKTSEGANIPFKDHHEYLISQFEALDDKHVFPILNKDVHINETQIKDRVKKCRTQYNKGLKDICKILGIETNVSSNTFRHQYASVLALKGVSVDVISRNMNHSSVEVTKRYLKKLGIDHEGDAADEYL